VWVDPSAEHRYLADNNSAEALGGHTTTGCMDAFKEKNPAPTGIGRLLSLQDP